MDALLERVDCRRQRGHVAGLAQASENAAEGYRRRRVAERLSLSYRG